MLSMLPVSLFQDIISGHFSVEEWSETAADMGLDAFDISILFVRDRTPAGISRMNKALRTGGLPLAMVATYPDFTNPDPDYAEKELHRALSDISVASDLGAQFVRITAGQYYPHVDEQIQLDAACRSLEVCAKYAERWGIQLLWENHSKPGAWEHPDFDYDVHRLAMFAERLKGGPIRLNYDIANACLLGYGVEYLDSCLSEIASIHINDVATVSPIRFCGIGDGIAPVAETIRHLRDLGYTGLFSVEEASMQGVDGVRHYGAVARRMLSE